ncbi:MAG: GNAT family N-acetyltransferase [Lachnospiraceae bacterium]|nr:GNAT family N-acetyltransferase [Lachnospiraceae bacterium]
MNLEEIVFSYKQNVIEGSFCNLIPIREIDLNDIVMLRNQERNKYFLHQESDITLEQQRIWYQKYCIRKDDIYWGIHNKKGNLVGTIRLYDISDGSCEEGSCIIDENYAKEAPYAIEAKYLTIQFAFEILHLNRMVNENKKDNRVMNSFSKQLGFEKIKTVTIRDAEFNYYVLTPEQFQKEKVQQILEYWSNR